MQQPIELTINSLQHVGIPVTNINNSFAFYSRLGFKNVMQAPFSINNEQGTAIMMQRGEIIIELYQLPDSHLAEIKSRSDGHVDHFAFDVPDIEVTFAVLKHAGYDILEPEPVFLQFWKKGCRYFNIKGPDGERIEFNQVL